MKGKLFLAVAVCLFSVLTAQAQNNFRLDEAQAQVFIKPDNLQIDLPFENKSQTFPAKIRLEVLNPNDAILTQIETRETIKRGRQMISISLPFNYSANSTDYLWYRLRYTIISENPVDKASISGIVSLSEITPEIFELRAVASEEIRSDMNFRVRVRAFQPVTNAPMPNVKISGEVLLELEKAGKDDKLKLESAGVTDSGGYAILDFKIPADAKLDNGDVKIVGEKNGIEREAENDLDAAPTEYSVYLNTDKPIYQPNQKLNVRGLFLQNGISVAAVKSIADKELEFVVKDEDDTVLYRETVKTSRFGIAAINWQIPENAKLGNYRVVVNADEDLRNDEIYFKVSRYDLPNFTVNAKPKKTFYLPDEATAEITVSADYLFGKPVAKGKVKIVQENSREWNYKQQKWDIEEERIYEGETGADGKFTVQADLSKAHEELKEREYKRFEDLTFAAYFTDATTNRTEQRSFDVRVTKEAIHAYIVGINSYEDQNPKLPIRFYVSTFYADGAPASCAVAVEGKYKDEENSTTLARIKTNSLGAGRVEFTAPKRKDDIYYQDLQIKVTASDSSGKKGTQEEEFEIDEDAKTIQIAADRAIYRTGEPMKIEIVSTETDKDVFVDIAQNWAVIESRVVRLKNNRAVLKIPYNPAFVNDLTVAAYIDDNGDIIKTSRGIIYPRPTNLRLDVAPVQAEYRPNEEAKINFTVSSFDKRFSETALGVFVFDKAIEERARTEADFGGSYVSQFGDYSRLLDDEIKEIDTSKTISKDLQLRVELVLADLRFSPDFFGSSEYDTNLKSIFRIYLDRQFVPIENALKNNYAKDYTHPTNDAELRKILSASGIDFGNLRDPWGNSYLAIFRIEREQNIISMHSAGANKSFGDRDDFTVLELKFEYFTPIGKALDRAVSDYHAATKNFIRDYATLRDELKKQNIDLDALRDRWNNPYRIEFGVSNRIYTIDFLSGGSNGKFENSYDDFTIWTNRTDFLKEIESRLHAILSNYASEKETFPKDEKEFQEIIKRGGIDFDTLRDGWNRPFDLDLTVSSRYADKVKIETRATYGEPTKQKTTVTPVTRQIAVFRLKSAGEDGIFSNYDDAILMTFSGIISEQNIKDEKPITQKSETIFTGGKGAIHGTVTDASGAFIPSAEIMATNEETDAVFQTTTNDNGVYILENLPTGKYTIRVYAAGFTSFQMTNAPIRASNLTELNVTLQVGATESVVEVTAGTDGLAIDATMSSVSSSSADFTLSSKNAVVKEEKSTPRLREYFPETLVWQPELVTDKNGKAELKFKLGDNLTTWKLYAIASNTKGEVGVTTREIKTFQPFFVDLEPPKFLTVGDEISLPVQIRNYTDAKQNVNVQMAGGDWFNFLDAADKTIEVAPNDSANAIFGFRANSVIREGKQRVTAIADKDSDAIEKPVTVKPNGKEIVRTQSEIFRDAVSFDVNFPANALPQSQKADLKIYPNLLAHVAESIEGLLQRPYGCGEQTVSSTYPNLMILKFTPKENKLHAQAENFLQKGYERLLGYQHADGGFSVWAQDAPDVALTAYALRFLTDAGDYIEVDEGVIKAARNWLIKQQRADGSWTRMYSWEKVEDAQRTKLMTTYVARTLAMIEKNEQEKSAEAQKSLQAALAYLKTRNEEIDEPYALALYGLASLDAGNSEDAKAIAAKLETMALSENAGAYWNLETNTPFYGWGTAGRIETTALVVQLLIKIQNDETQKTRDLISKGTTFLLRNKDRYGVWYSTQTTINVLDAFLAAFGDGESKTKNEIRTAEIFVNNQKFKDIALPAENQLSFPISIELPTTVNINRIEVKVGGNQSALMTQIVQTHYISWQDYEANGRTSNQSRALRLEYDCDKLEVKPTEEISCRVEAERIGFKGYGMLLAEIGLPPGADVDRASLEKAKIENLNFSRYEVLPDRIIVYLWTQAGGTHIDFKFRPRYGINAQTAPSVVYDYYNAEAQATVAPLKFSVK